LARALGCTRQTANERVQSLAAFRFQGNPVFCIVPSQRTRKGTWTRNGYRVLPISSLRIYDRPGENSTVSANPDMGSPAAVSASTVSANPDTNKNQRTNREEDRSNFERSPDEHVSDADDLWRPGRRRRAVPEPAADAVESTQRRDRPLPPGARPLDPQRDADAPSPDDDQTAAAESGYENFRRALAQFRTTRAEQRRLEAPAAPRRRSRDVGPPAPASPPSPTTPLPARSAAAGEPLPGATPRSPGRPRGSWEQRAQIGAYLTDIMRELHDQAALPSSVSRALNLFAQANVPPERWGNLLYEARAITQERSGRIAKQITLDSGWDVKNKAPYYFAVLTDLVGLKDQGAVMAARRSTLDGSDCRRPLPGSLDRQNRRDQPSRHGGAHADLAVVVPDRSSS
jgi:hypothetical protein